MGPFSYAAIFFGVGAVDGVLAYFSAFKLTKRLAALACLLIVALNFAIGAWLFSIGQGELGGLAGAFLMSATILGWWRGRRSRTISAHIASGFLILVLGAVSMIAVSSPILGNFARFQASRSAERERLKSAEAAAQQCLAGFARRNPQEDAEHDFARGDSTPIGVTYTPHDPPETQTHYEGACEYGYAGTYQRTGKWFTYPSQSFALFEPLPSQLACGRAARNYMTNYNRRMTALAPEAVRSFCLSRRLASGPRLGTAAIAVLGTARPKREVVNGIALETSASLVIDTPFGPVLLTETYDPDASKACQDCPGGIGVAYLSEDGARISLLRRWPLVVTGGTDPRQRYGMSFGRIVTSYPAVHVDDTQSDGQRRCGWERIIELRPDGPVYRGTVHTNAAELRGPQPQHFVGEFQNIVRDSSFDVVVSGTDIRDHYQITGGRFVGPVNSRLKC